MRYRIKTQTQALYHQVLEVLERHQAQPKVASEKRGVVSVDDLSPVVIRELEALDASVTQDPQYSPDR